MKVVHVLQGLTEYDGISVFARNVVSCQVAAGHTCFFVRQPGLKFLGKIDASVRIYESNGCLDCLEINPDVVHIHGLWSPFVWRALAWCRKHGVKYVVSPHGGLMPRVMHKGWIKKNLVYLLLLRRNLNAASLIHCTGEGELDAVNSLRIKARKFVLPLGCELPEWPVRKIYDSRKTILFLSRIGEEKGLVFLLDAWNSIDHSGWRLVLAGPDWNFRGFLERKITTDGIADVEFTGFADADMKDRLYRSASFFVLPSPMENFSMVVLDALAYGIPVICTRGTPWKCIEDNDCGWWVIPNSAKSISNALRIAIQENESRYEHQCNNARRLAERFSWKNIADELLKHYAI